jgi:hypothetical protein
MRPLAVAVCVVVAALFLACEKPDRSYVTSPTLKTLIGTTTGNVAYGPPESVPTEKDAPDHWQLSFGLARWSELENGSPALEIVAQVATRPGGGFELWLESADGVAARWSGGSTAAYVGTVCFQLELERDGEAVPIGPGPHHVTMAFRDPVEGVIAASRRAVTNETPHLEGSTPAQGSEVFGEALACRRGQ